MKVRTFGYGRTWIHCLGMVAALLCVGSSFAGAAIDPVLAAKAERVQSQMEQRVTDAEREAAAAALRKLREEVAAAKKLNLSPTSTTTSIRKGSALIDFDTIPTAPNQLLRNGQPKPPDYYTTANWANSPPLAKFVDTLPGLGAANANNLGNYIPVAVPDTLTYPGSDYYEIDLVEYNQQMHSDLPVTGTKLRGYVQVNVNATTNVACGNQTGVVCNDPMPALYLGPTIVSERDRPVRIKFTNRLPAGAGGDLFIPVDTTVMGAGNGPASPSGVRGVGEPCDNTMEPNTCAPYTQNRADIHLHGGRTPWISDGTPHQWITPADENTPLSKGVSLQNVPDMPDPGDGASTYYYTNQQSARLMFYHDHAFGITRLNVYAGEAAGYVITDQYEQDLINRGLLPSDQIPLIIQDKTFVDASEIRKYDPLWNWGSGTPDANGVRPPVEGDLWLPHVYMPAQTSIAGFGGVNPFGRWMYGPWFYPPTAVEKGPVANPYYDPDCSSTNPAILADCQTPGQPEQIPGTPNTSMGMEAFQDSVVVNGTAFPSLTVDPRAYRFRILNAASDRFWNLSFYEADSDPANVSPDPRLLAAGKSNKTEVKILPASIDLATLNGWPENWPVDGRDGGVPDPATRGPSFLQIGTEGGFLPKPTIREPQPVTWMTDPTAFWVGVVDKTGLALGPAERADVIVDFSAYAGKTLILYNDAPAAWPARVASYDYFTGAPDMRDGGGYGAGGVYNPITGVYDGGHGILPGYAPNTRTVMQIVVTGGTSGLPAVDPPYTFNPAALQAEFVPANPATPSLFAKAQEPIIVGQPAYQEVYPNSYFPTNFPWEGISQINDQTINFVTVDNTAANPQHVVAIQEPKGIHDEMGASFDPVYGRMSGNLAMQLPNPTTLNALLILYGYSDLPTETIKNSPELKVSILPGTTTLADGTQIWKISHNGVDTHPIHFHIFDVQLINRVGWDGQIALPEANELGWKDTIKISPLMDTIVAVRPRAPALPFGISNSLRPLNPAIPIDSTMGFNSVDWMTGEARTPAVTNVLYNFGWEYVWHCHILSHEEMDMMRPIVLQVDTLAADDFILFSPAPNATNGVDLSWTDTTPVDYSTNSGFGNSKNEIGFNIWRSSNGTGAYTKVGAALANQTTFNDISGTTNDLYVIESFNASGSTYTSALSAVTLNVSATTAAAPATIDMSAVVGAPLNQTVTKVEFFNGTTLLATDTTAPYSFIWSPVQQGVYDLIAKATDSNGLIAYSATTQVTVTSSLVADFTVNGGAEIGVCDTVTLTDTSTGGTVTAWNWLVNGVTYTTQSPVLPLLPAGTYAVTLKVTGSVGNVAQVTKNVVIVNHAPTANAGGPYLLSFAGTGTVDLLGVGGDPLDPCNPSLSYAWDVDNNGVYDYFTQNRTLKYSVLAPWLGIGPHTITLKVTDAQGAATTATATLTIGSGPATGVTVTPSYASPYPAGGLVTFTAAATGGDPGPYEYRFRYRSAVAGTPWTTAQNYSPSATWTWNTTGRPVGAYQVVADVRHTGSAVAFEAQKVIAYSLSAAIPASAVNLGINVTSPQPVGTAITFTGVAVGGDIRPYEYRFSYRIGVAGTVWTTAQAYSPSATWNWNNAALVPGSYQVRVEVRHVGTAVTFEAQKVVSYSLTAAAPATAVSLVPTVPSPQATGTPITFNALASGGDAGPYEYRFRYRNNLPGTAFTVAQNYSASTTWIWNTTGRPAGGYQVVVDVRHVGSPVTFEAQKVVNYSLLP